ncbi:hypothetical protein PAMA_013930 [Pampus argenteus]
MSSPLICIPAGTGVAGPAGKKRRLFIHVYLKYLKLLDRLQLLKDPHSLPEATLHIKGVTGRGRNAAE